MKICFISDTHNLHRVVHYLEKEQMENVDLLIHAGDISMSGTELEIKDFIRWLNDFPAKYKIFIGGNHDRYLEKVKDGEIRKLLSKNVFYLNNNGISLENICIWGSPVQPGAGKSTFKKRSGEEITKYWRLIPKGIDILVTHGPPFGILDRTKKGANAGCKDLLKRIRNIKPAYHVFGHIHENYGQLYDGITRYINASLLNERYRLLNDPVILDYRKNLRTRYSLFSLFRK